MSSDPRNRLAVDIGGTFTDVALETAAGQVTAKVATTPRAPEAGVMTAVEVALAKAGLEPAELSSVLHGTTLASNALIERKGAVTALITTEGFRDSVEIGYENRFAQYDIGIEKPAPLVPRRRRYDGARAGRRPRPGAAAVGRGGGRRACSAAEAGRRRKRRHRAVARPRQPGA